MEEGCQEEDAKVFPLLAQVAAAGPRCCASSEHGGGGICGGAMLVVEGERGEPLMAPGWSSALKDDLKVGAKACRS